MQLLPVTSFGWKLDKDEALQIEWNSDIKSVSHFYWGAVNAPNQNAPLEYAPAEKLEGYAVQAVAVLAAPTNQVKVLILSACSQTTHKMYRHRHPHVYQHALVQLPLHPPPHHTHKIYLPHNFYWILILTRDQLIHLKRSIQRWDHRWRQLWWTVNWRNGRRIETEVITFDSDLLELVNNLFTYM